MVAIDCKKCGRSIESTKIQWCESHGYAPPKYCKMCAREDSERSDVPCESCGAMIEKDRVEWAKENDYKVKYCKPCSNRKKKAWHSRDTHGIKRLS